MAVTDLHSLDISTPLNKMFETGATIPGAVLSLVEETPQINIGENKPLVMAGRARGALVHEGGAKPDNGRTPVPKPFTTVKLVYSQRVTDEFMDWDEGRQGDFISQLVNDWTTKSLPRDIDTAVIHGYDPYSNTRDTELSDYITKPGSSLYVPSTGDTGAAIDTDITSAVSELSKNGYKATGIAIDGDAAIKLGTVMNGNVQKYPGIGAFGLAGNNIAGLKAASTPEVGAVDNTKAILADWQQLLLGFAGQANWRVHTAGNPDGGEHDLAQVNMVLIRLETFFGFRVLDPNAFAVIQTQATGE